MPASHLKAAPTGDRAAEGGAVQHRRWRFALLGLALLWFIFISLQVLGLLHLPTGTLWLGAPLALALYGLKPEALAPIAYENTGAQIQLENASQEAHMRTLQAIAQMAAHLQLLDQKVEAQQTLLLALSQLLTNSAQTGGTSRAHMGSQKIEAHSLGAQSAALLQALNRHTSELSKLLDQGLEKAHLRKFLEDGSAIYGQLLSAGHKSALQAEIRTLMHSDPAIRTEAQSYIGLFKHLVQRLMAEQEGEVLTLVLLSSDLGKLYLLLNEMIEAERLH